ncbi:hypothetical protein [Ruegeria arenilitoris]|uniref:hypothetical protein n=1 Tax=Ruegeria arenilitoris TaxID=1173585 RepID=UPI00147C3EF3|nr:hypothetical protein [Ruegeria arenilitoris]
MALDVSFIRPPEAPQLQGTYFQAYSRTVRKKAKDAMRVGHSELSFGDLNAEESTGHPDRWKNKKDDG